MWLPRVLVGIKAMFAASPPSIYDTGREADAQNFGEFLKLFALKLPHCYMAEGFGHTAQTTQPVLTLL